MDSAAKSQQVYKIFQTIAGNYDRANERISLGLQKHWKRMLVAHIAQNVPLNTKLLDVCCGTGDIALLTAAQRPDIHITGVDFSPAMLEQAQRKSRQYTNVTWKEADALQLPFPDNTFASVCISFGLRNTADYTQTLQEMKRVAAAGGYVYCLDSFVPDNAFIRYFHMRYFKYLVPLLGGGARYCEEYTWLHESTQQFLRKQALIDLYNSIDITHVECKSRMFGACILVQGQKP